MSGERMVWLNGGSHVCNPAPRRQLQPRRLVLLGAPGIGKTTQAKLLCGNLGACYLSTDDLFCASEHLEPGECRSPSSSLLDDFGTGALQSDSSMIETIRQRVPCLVCRGGFLLDGFPRTVVQAKALDQMLRDRSVALEAVLSYELSHEQLVARSGGRLVCTRCNSVFNSTARPSKKAGICDICSGNLSQRKAVRPEDIREAAEAYETRVEPLLEYYRRQNLLVTIAAAGTPEQVYESAVVALNARAVFSCDVPPSQT